MSGRREDRADAGFHGWLSGRTGGVPAAFRPWLKVGEALREAEAGNGRSVDEGKRDATESVGEADAHDVARELERRGLDALRTAVSAPGRNRDSAFHLLAADAYLTWSAEALVESSEPEPALRAFLRRVAAEDA